MERREVLKVLTKAAGGTLLPASAPSLLARLTGHSTGLPGDLLADQSSSKDRRGARRQAVNYVNPFIGTTGAGLRWMMLPGACEVRWILQQLWSAGAVRDRVCQRGAVFWNLEERCVGTRKLAAERILVQGLHPAQREVRRVACRCLQCAESSKFRPAGQHHYKHPRQCRRHYRANDQSEQYRRRALPTVVKKGRILSTDRMQ